MLYLPKISQFSEFEQEVYFSIDFDILEQTDLNLINGIKNNRQAAFDELFRKYYKNLVYFAISLVKNHDSANEVVQDLFVNLWEKRHQLEPKVSLKAYLYRSVYNNCIHFLKSEKKQLGSDFIQFPEMEDDFADRLEMNELEIKIFGLIEELPAECRRIFKMSRFDELKYTEIALELNLSVKTVETQISRALKFLRQNLPDYFKLLILMILD